ncbi:DUF4830 domain-containing protein [Paenibacillus sp. FSL F4-0125]|uniref:DUF4830 domain-containing protein n=1 Tax=Paenibacillus sp. FSL F4-0125 TaxID=2954730 RepID=UPI0030FA34C8
MARRQFIMIVLTCLPLFLNTGCNEGKKASPTIQSSIWKPEVFLQTLDYKVQSQPDKFLVGVPQDWEVKLGEYPEGLYWRLANVFSKDAGFDLTTLKGSDVEAWRYSLVDGLPGSEGQSGFSYPSNLILLVQSGNTVGAWLEFNVQSVGPSIKKRSLTDITGLTFDEWTEREGLFADAGENGDLASLGHFELLDAFFQAIQEGNHTRARACLNPNALLTALTVNRQAHHLYNSGFGGENALSESIVEAKPNAYKVMDYDSGSEIKDIGDRTTINVVVDLYMKSLNPVFDTPDGQETRFAVLTKHANGWKIGGLGTGP